jgi:hypothetical protein
MGVRSAPAHRAHATATASEPPIHLSISPMRTAYPSTSHFGHARVRGLGADVGGNKVGTV